MKKIAILLAAFTTVVGTPLSAQNTGRAATAGKQATAENFQWGIALFGLAVLGTVVGLTAASTSSSPSPSIN